MGRKVKMDYENENQRVQVSYTIAIETKESALMAAEKHGRTLSQQLDRSLNDGLKLQALIGKVSDYLTEKTEGAAGEELLLKPSEDSCIGYIIKTVEAAIKQGR